MKAHYILCDRHGTTYALSNWCYDLEEARRWRDKERKDRNDESIHIVRVRYVEEEVE